MSTTPLALAISAAVPLEIERLRTVDDELRATQIAAFTSSIRYPGDLIGQHGDDLLYGGRHCATTFAELARALACLAWAIGGVTYAGMHFCARHEECKQADAELEAAA